MATYTGSEAITVTLVASTVDTITLTGAGTELRISQTSTTPIYIITAQPGQTPATPTVGGAGTTAIMTNYPVVLPWTGSGIVIKVISAGTGTVNFILTTSKFAPQGDLALKADLISPTFTGTPTLPTGTIATTQTAADSSTKVATTAFVTSAVASVGMWKISTTSLSGVTTNISNCFSSTYANYRVLVTNLNNSTVTLRSLSIRFRTTSDDTASNYNYGTFGMFGGGTAFAGGAANQNSAVIGSISSQPSGNAASGFTIDILSPNTATGTTFTGTLLTYQADTGSFVYRSIGGNNTTTTQYTGFSIIGVTDSLSGTVQVYGYN